jgi:hypothetical protein
MLSDSKLCEIERFGFENKTGQGFGNKTGQEFGFGNKFKNETRYPTLFSKMNIKLTDNMLFIGRGAIPINTKDYQEISEILLKIHYQDIICNNINCQLQTEKQKLDTLYVDLKNLY